MIISSEIIRSKPKFEIILYNDYFEIINDDYPKENGKYLLKNVDSIEFKPKKVNWLMSIVSIIADIISSGSGAGGIYNKDSKMEFSLNGNIKEAKLLDCDLKKAEKIITKIKQAINN